MNLCTSLIFKYHQFIYVVIFAFSLNSNVWSQTKDSVDDKQFVISDIQISGNHRTRHKIIFRELVF